MKKRDKDVVFVEQTHVFCDGGDNEEGHPKVYLEISNGSSIICPYCSKEFRLKRRINKL
jgi:uncharacterized Zn-finger protein